MLVGEYNIKEGDVSKRKSSGRPRKIRHCLETERTDPFYSRKQLKRRLLLKPALCLKWNVVNAFEYENDDDGRIVQENLPGKVVSW